MNALKVLLSVHKFARSQTDRINSFIAMTIQKGRRHRGQKAELPDYVRLLVKSASDNETIDREDTIDKEDSENEMINEDDGEDERIDGDD